MIDLDDLRMLALWRPWAWAVSTGAKLIENRTWRPPAAMIGRPLAIYAARRWDPQGATFLRHRGLVVPEPAAHDYFAILAIVTIRAVVEGDATSGQLVDWLERHGTDPRQAEMYFGPVGWLLSDVRTLARPVYVRGGQGLRRVPAPAVAQIAAQL